MKKRQNTFASARALQITFSIALIFVSAILLALAAPGNPKQTFGQSPLGGPTLGNYPDTSLPLIHQKLRALARFSFAEIILVADFAGFSIEGTLNSNPRLVEHMLVNHGCAHVLVA
jgi:hypothetical protein